MNPLLQRISIDPNICFGKPCIRGTRNPSLKLLGKLVGEFLQALNQNFVEEKLWIVEIGRIRIHQPNEDD